MTKSPDRAKQPDAPVEIELKLGLTPDAMERLVDSPLLREHARSTLRSRELKAVYYDTPDRRLRARGAAFRVREAEGRHVQTLKSARRPDTAAPVRAEWEAELDGPAPRPQAFADPAALDLAGLLLPGQLEPVFETRVRRRSLVVGWADGDGRPAQIEAAFDDGAVLADGRELPISELELELLEGDSAALFGLAEAIRGVAPLRIEPLDKSARGWLLATGEAPAVVKATPVALDRSGTVDDALAATLGSALRHWLDNEPSVLDGSSPEGLHQFRVALRRLRSAFSLFADALPEGARRRWADELRWLLGPLGPARDLDVLIEQLLPPLVAERGAEPGLVAFREAAEARRAAAREAVGETLRSERYADLAFGFAAWVAKRGWREGADVDLRLRQRDGVAGFAADVLDRRNKKVRRRGKRFKHLTPDQRHELRIALKKLRYGVEFFASLFPAKRMERYRKALAEMQDRLGHLNDVAVASRLAHEIVDPLGPEVARAAASGGGQVVGWYAHQVGTIEPETVASWRALRKIGPAWR